MLEFPRELLDKELSREPQISSQRLKPTKKPKNHILLSIEMYTNLVTVCRPENHP